MTQVSLFTALHPRTSRRKLQQEADREISAPSTGETNRPSPPPTWRHPEAEERAAGNEGSPPQEVSSLHQMLKE